MGDPMTRNLAKAGFPLVVWNRTAEKAHVLSAQTGCDVAETPRDLANQSDVVLTMLADDASSVAVHFGIDGLFSGEGAQTIIEMGTMSPGHIAKLVSEAPDGVKVIDAPVSGSTPVSLITPCTTCCCRACRWKT